MLANLYAMCSMPRLHVYTSIMVLKAVKRLHSRKIQYILCYTHNVATRSRILFSLFHVGAQCKLYNPHRICEYSSARVCARPCFMTSIIRYNYGECVANFITPTELNYNRTTQWENIMNHSQFNLLFVNTELNSRFLYEKYKKRL